MTVFFLRHGMAEERERWSGEDFDRPLTDHGRELLRDEARGIERLALDLDSILSSPFARAYRTAEIVARALGLLDLLEKNDLLGPGFDAGKLAELLSGRDRESSVLLVGHEPDFGKTIGAVIGGGRVRCKKGGLVCLELESASPPRGELLWALPPAFLARLDGN